MCKILLNRVLLYFESFSFLILILVLSCHTSFGKACAKPSQKHELRACRGLGEDGRDEESTGDEIVTLTRTSHSFRDSRIG